MFQNTKLQMLRATNAKKFSNRTKGRDFDKKSLLQYMKQKFIAYNTINLNIYYIGDIR